MNRRIGTVMHEATGGGPLDGLFMRASEAAAYPCDGDPDYFHVYFFCNDCSEFHYDGLRLASEIFA